MLKLAFSILFGLLTFVLRLPVGGEKLFAEVGRAALLLGLLFGLFVVVASIKNVSILEWILRRRRGRQFAVALCLLTVLSVGGYLAARSSIKVPEGWVLYVEMLLYALANLCLALLLAATGGWIAMRLMKKQGTSNSRGEEKS